MHFSLLVLSDPTRPSKYVQNNRGLIPIPPAIVCAPVHLSSPFNILVFNPLRLITRIYILSGYNSLNASTNVMCMGTKNGICLMELNKPLPPRAKKKKKEHLKSMDSPFKQVAYIYIRACLFCIQ
jgi:hypothetical protein